MKATACRGFESDGKICNEYSGFMVYVTMSAAAKAKEVSKGDL